MTDQILFTIISILLLTPIVTIAIAFNAVLVLEKHLARKQYNTKWWQFWNAASGMPGALLNFLVSLSISTALVLTYVFIF